MTWLSFPAGRTLVPPSGKHKATAEVEEPDVNSQLSYSLAQAHHEQLHRDAERARMAAELSRPTRFSVVWQRIRSARAMQRHLQAQRPVARGAGEI
jgi:hypothetical protein